MESENEEAKVKEEEECKETEDKNKRTEKIGGKKAKCTLKTTVGNIRR